MSTIGREALDLSVYLPFGKDFHLQDIGQDFVLLLDQACPSVPSVIKNEDDKNIDSLRFSHSMLVPTHLSGSNHARWGMETSDASLIGGLCRHGPFGH